MELSGIPIPQMNWDSDNLPETWSKFCEHCYLITSGPLKDKEESVKASYFQLWIGDKGREIITSLELSNAEKKKIDTVQKRIKDYLQPKVNPVFARYQFNHHIQTDQSFEQFLTSLRITSKKCKFQNSDEMMRDRIVFGIKSQKIREKLIHEGEGLTLDKAIDICQSYEYNQKQLKEMMQQSETTTVNEIKSRRRINQTTAKSGSSAHHGGQSSSMTSTSRGQRAEKQRSHNNKRRSAEKCDRCGYSHNKEKCPAHGKQCDNCKKWNHFAAVCRSKTVSEINQNSDESSDDSFFVDSVDNGYIKDNQAFVELKVGSHSIQIKLDTGSQVNILPESCYYKLGCAGPLEHAPGNLTAYNGGSLNTLGYRTIPCTYKDKVIDIGFYIVKTNSKPILGLQSCIDLSLINFVYSVDDDSKTGCDQPLTKTEVLNKYADLFTGIGLSPGECEIHLDPNAQPVIHPPRRVPVALHARLKAELDRMERNEIITKVNTPTEWVNSLVIIEKPSAELRVCLDPMHLNKAILRPHYPSRTLEDVLPKLSGAKVFTKIDVKSAYWTVKLTEKSSYYTCFNSPFGRYRFLRLPFGLKSSQDEFQRRIDECFEHETGVVGIADDIIVFGDTRAAHDRNLKNTLQRCLEMGLKLNKDKIEIGVTEISYFGHTLTCSGLAPDPSKIAAIRDMAPPNSRAELETIFGMINYLSKFAPNLAEITAPLRALLKKPVEFSWDEPQATAFQKVKDLLTQNPGPILSYYDVTKPLTLQVDASKHGLGSTLLQDDKPIAYASKSLTQAEMNYSQIEKEMFAIVFGCRRFHQYVYARKVRVETDHLPLVSIVKKPLCAAPPRLQRMLLQLQRYDLDVHHLPGKCIPVADTLSRKPLTDTYPSYSNGIDIQVHTVVSNLPISDKKLEEIRKQTDLDIQMQRLSETILHGWPNSRKQCPETVADFWNFRDELSLTDRLILKGSKIVIPPALRSKMLDILHTGHMGIEKCQIRARDTMFWPRISVDIADMVSKCAICQERRNSNPKEPLSSHPIAEHPFQICHSDLFEWENKTFLVVTDSYSRFFEVVQMSNSKSSSVIQGD